MKKTVNRMEYLSDEMLKDLGFIEIKHDHDGCIEINNCERAYRHLWLDPKNLILVDYDNGGWHFAQRKGAINGIGHIVWLDDLLTGFKFVTGHDLLNLPK